MHKNEFLLNKIKSQDHNKDTRIEFNKYYSDLLYYILGSIKFKVQLKNFVLEQRNK